MKLNIEKTRQKLNQSADGVSIDLEHIKNEHSDIQSEIKIGQKARTANDLILIPYLLNNFDEAKLSPKHDDNLGNRAITIKKQINGVSVIGTIERGKNGVYVVTHWQTVSAAPMSQAPGRNVLNDADKHKIQQDIAKVKSDSENSSKILDENGEPLVVYHGSSADFAVFDHRFGYRNGAAEGRGFYFTSDKSKAEGYKTENGKLFEVYLSLQKPLNPDELTITKAEVEKIIRAIDTDGTYVSDYAENDIGYPGKTWHSKAVRSAFNAIYDSSDNNADIVAEIYSVFGQGDALAKITEATGYDGFIKDDVYVVFNSTQIKSATDNIGTFDRTNPDIRFSLLDADALKDLSPLERLTEAFEESEPNEIDRNIYIVFRKYMDELIEQGSVKQDSDFARANAVLQNYERDHGIHQASLLYRKMIADKMFALPVFKESIGTADDVLKNAPEVPKDFANAVKTVFTGAKFKSVLTEEERKIADRGEAIEAERNQEQEQQTQEQPQEQSLDIATELEDTPITTAAVPSAPSSISPIFPCRRLRITASLISVSPSAICVIFCTFLRLTACRRSFSTFFPVDVFVLQTSAIPCEPQNCLSVSPQLQNFLLFLYF